MAVMEINVIVRVHDREEYIPHLFKVMETWQSTLKINAIVCYSGKQEPDWEYDFVSPVPTDPWPRSYSLNDWVKILRGYRRIKITGCSRFLCLCADSWLCDPSTITKTFERMEQLKCGYGGNWWNNGFANPGVSSDIFFADTRFGNVFENLNTFDASAKPGEPGQCLECWIKHHCITHGIGIYIVHKREPVHPNNRFTCEALKWSMEHDLSKNLANARRWGILA
jgi:hypothetical protein